jgi:hypothetical protein
VLYCQKMRSGHTCTWSYRISIWNRILHLVKRLYRSRKTSESNTYWNRYAKCSSYTYVDIIGLSKPVRIISIYWPNSQKPNLVKILPLLIEGTIFMVIVKLQWKNAWEQSHLYSKNITHVKTLAVQYRFIFFKAISRIPVERRPKLSKHCFKHFG